jgi:hypothetical protein
MGLLINPAPDSRIEGEDRQEAVVSLRCRDKEGIVVEAKVATEVNCHVVHTAALQTWSTCKRNVGPALEDDNLGVLREK